MLEETGSQPFRAGLNCAAPTELNSICRGAETVVSTIEIHRVSVRGWMKVMSDQCTQPTGVEMTKNGAATAATRLQQKAVSRALGRTSGAEAPWFCSRVLCRG